MIDEEKNTEVAKDNLPTTNDFQYNGMIGTLKRLEEKAALRKTAKPHEEAASNAEVDKTSREFILATNEMYGRHGSFPLDSGSDNFTHEQRRAYRKLYAEIQARIQFVNNGGVDESRLFESMPEFARAFGIELPEAFKEKKHTDKQEEPKQKGWMPKKYTPVDSAGKVLESEDVRPKKGSSVHEVQEEESGDQPEKQMKELKIEDS